MKLFPTSLFASCVLALLSTSANAQSLNNIEASVNIAQSCVLESPQELAFGDYDATGTHLAAPNDTTATFVVRCTKGSLAGAPLQISLGAGLNHDGEGCVNKRMSNGNGSFLNYEVYATAGRTAKWGCMNLGENGFSSSTIDDGTRQTITMYGRIPPAQANSRAGSYSDTIDILLSF